MAASIAAALLAAPAASAAAGPCGTRGGAAPKTYRHVIVIMDENRGIGDVIGAPGSSAARSAPYLNRLAGECGLATNYRSATHPSHPNYMAVTGGIASPLAAVNAQSIFAQVAATGRSWRVYEGGMKHPCERRADFPYKPGHNPGVSYLPLAGACRANDTNLSALLHDIRAQQLPTYAFIAPDQCNDMELACTAGTSAITTGDRWLQKWVPRLMGTPGFRRGRTAIFITWDEGDHGHGTTGEDCVAPVHRNDVSCHVATIVLSQYVTAGMRSSAFFSHYSLLQTTERLLGLRPFLGRAGDTGTTGMRSAFGF